MSRTLLLIAALCGIVGLYATPQASAQGKETPSARRQSLGSSGVRAKQSGPLTFPPLLGCILPGAMQISGKLSVDANPTSFKVERNYKPVELDGAPTIDHTSGFFSVKLKERLLSGNGVRLTVGSVHVDREVSFECEPVILAPQVVTAGGRGSPSADSGNQPAPGHTPAANALPPSIVPPVYEGDTQINVQLHTPDARVTEVHVNEQKVDASSHAPNASGLAVVTLPALKANQEVQVVAPPGPPSNRATVAPKPSPPPGPKGLPTGLNAPKDGASVVTGKVNDAGATEVDLFINGSSTVAGSTTTIDPTTGAFAITLPAGTTFAVNQSLVAKPDHGEPSLPVNVKGLPAEIDTPHAGDTKLTATVHVGGVNHFDVLVDGKSVSGTSSSAVDGSSDKFTITLPDASALAVNQVVVVKPNQGEESQPVTVAAVAAVAVDPPKVSVLKEGDKTVSGSVEGDADHVLVTVLDHRKAFLEEKKGEPDATSRAFIVGLTHTLAEDDVVQVRSLRTSAKSEPTEVRVESSVYNWGRVRAYFSLGAVTSKDDDNFQKVRPFLSLNLDKNWINSVHCYPPRLPQLSKEELELPAERQKELLIARVKPTLLNESELLLPEHEQKRLIEGRLKELRSEVRSSENYKRGHEDWRWRCDQQPFTDRRWYWLLNTYFEARLQSANSLSISQLNTANLKTGDRVGYYEFGIYAPYNHVKFSWPFDGQRNVLFLAPLFKGGMETIPSPSTGRLDAESNFKFLAGGFRIGHYRAFPNSHSVAPELISWVDFTWGRWDRMLRGPALPKVVPMRFESTGRLKIPFTPFTIGFTANTGPGADEFSLFGGTRFDLSRILSKIAPNIK